MKRLEVRGVHKRFGDVDALAGVSLEVAPGEAVALLGPNGAGKTTLLSIIGGAVEADAGEVIADGVRMSPDDTSARRRFGFVPQEPAVYPIVSARQNLRFTTRLYGAGKEAIAEGLELAGLSERADERVHRLSIGMQRRLSIAMGLVHHPQLILLDEPMVGVDPHSRDRIITVLRERASAGAAVIYTTHHIRDAETFCDRVIVIDHGKVIVDGPVPEVVARYSTGVVELVFAERQALAPALCAKLRALEGVREAEFGAYRARLTAVDPAPVVQPLIEELSRAQISFRSLRVVAPSLESAFFTLTGTESRDA